MILVRHAQPLVAPGVCYGALDVAADPDATRLAALALAKKLPHHAKVTASPLQRCERLAQCLQGIRTDLTYRTDARLAEMNFGSWEGQRWDSVPQQAFDAWTADFWRHRFGGSESVAEFMARVALAWQEVQAESSDSTALTTNVWIAHAGVIRAMSLIAMGQREVHEAALWPAAAPIYGEAWCLPVRFNSGMQTYLPAPVRRVD
jgi:alpha-ribazole phosphatase